MCRVSVTLVAICASPGQHKQGKQLFEWIESFRVFLFEWMSLWFYPALNDLHKDVNKNFLKKKKNENIKFKENERSRHYFDN